jgi:hypothetical protein
MMRRLLVLALLLAASVARAAGTAPASCPAGTYWTRSQTAAGPNLSGTTYTITAPCFVTFGADFVVTVSAANTNPAWFNHYTSVPWEVDDVRIDASSATSILGRGGLLTLDASGLWTQALHNAYTTGAPVNHRIEFHYYDVGNNPDFPSAHGFSASFIGTVTYDPYPDSSVTPPVGTAPANPAATPPESSGGCGSTGTVPALLGLGAVLAAAWPRRRARS